MHKYSPNIYYFIDKYNFTELQQINKNVSIIYRNYKEKVDEKIIILIKKYCNRTNRKFYLANNIKIAIKLKLDGLYIPSFNRALNTKNLTKPLKFDIIGSAHNEPEIRIKVRQGCNLIFLGPIFKVKKKKNYLGISRFNKLSLNQKIRLVALGGINAKNISKINLLNCLGFAGISWIKKNGPNKFRPFL